MRRGLKALAMLAAIGAVFAAVTWAFGHRTALLCDDQVRRVLLVYHPDDREPCEHRFRIE